jgi:hypothetical protein
MVVIGNHKRNGLKRTNTNTNTNARANHTHPTTTRSPYRLSSIVLSVIIVAAIGQLLLDNALESIGNPEATGTIRKQNNKLPSSINTNDDAAFSAVIGNASDYVLERMEADSLEEDPVEGTANGAVERKEEGVETSTSTLQVQGEMRVEDEQVLKAADAPVGDLNANANANANSDTASFANDPDEATAPEQEETENANTANVVQSEIEEVEAETSVDHAVPAVESAQESPVERDTASFANSDPVDDSTLSTAEQPAANIQVDDLEHNINIPPSPPAVTMVQQGTIDSAIQTTRKIFLNRQQAYRDSTRSNSTETWRMRGIGYVYHRHKLLLAAVLPEGPSLQPGRNVIQVFNTIAESQTDCDKWTIWVRVAGPEIFAGSALPVQADTFPGQNCHWEFPFHLQVSGEYFVDSKILLYNGQAPPAMDKCEMHKDYKINLDQFPLSIGFLGFKLYGPESESCCEICAREPECKYWTTPPLSIVSPVPSRWKGCELFFDEPVDTNDEKALSRRLRQISRGHGLLERHMVAELQRHRRLPANESTLHPNFRPLLGVPNFWHGRPHQEPVAYFVGCGWNFWHTQTYACLDTTHDDAVPIHPVDTFTFQANTEPEQKQLRKCTLTDELPPGRYTMMTDTGRWVRLPWPDDTMCPLPMEIDRNFSGQFEIIGHDGERPHCWHRDDLSIIGKRCIEFCAHNKVHHPWFSRIHEQKQWFGVFKKYECDYVEFTDAELQQCVDRKKISSVKLEGASISAFYNNYVQQRLANIRFYNASASPDPSQHLEVVLSTLAFPHLLWHMTTKGWEKTLDETPAVKPNEEKYFLSGFYYSSEREPHVQVEHAEQLTRMAYDKLTPKGWKMINAFDLTAAFTYDTATQMDGLHMIGPPTKMGVVKFFHHLCDFDGSTTTAGETSDHPDEAITGASQMGSEPSVDEHKADVERQEVEAVSVLEASTASGIDATGNVIDILSTAVSSTREIFLERQHAYSISARNNSKETWRMRGIGYMYHRHQIMLAAILPESPIGQGRQVVKVFNTLQESQPECDKWTIWVRVAGPEIFAGSALAVNSTEFPGQSCHWEFPFDLQVSGEYDVDSKVLIYNGEVPPAMDKCEMHKDYNISLDEFPLSTGFLGFKLYGPESESCCEICAREPACKYWTTPPLSIVSPLPDRWKGCELFFDEPVDSHDAKALSRRLKQISSGERSF